MQPNSGYQIGGSAGASTSTDAAPNAGYWSLGKLKKSYQDYLGSKREEIDEQKSARRYYHAAQWTAAEIAALKKRLQPVVTFNRIGRKIDGVVGLLERMRQDPKGFPRTPQHQEGADIATYTLRYVLDQQEWKAKSPECARDGAIDGIGGIQIELEQGDQGDVEVGFEVVEPDTFFYDPRSFKLDFSDARFLGTAKWLDLELACEMFPDKEQELRAASHNDGSDLTTDSDRDTRWYDSNGTVRRVRVVDEWYQHKGEWCWAIFTGSLVLMEGKSYLRDEKKKSACRYIMFSANVDHDGDRYGFVRNMKSAQDEINHRRSKGLHELSSRRLMAERGAFDDVEKARTEAKRADGVIIRNKGFEAEFDDSAKMANLEGQFKFLENAYAELENFGPNPALIGQGIENKSGRAIALLQQAGTAELGPYILAYRGWKLRVYRALWNAIQQHWSGERWIRVTDDQNVAQFIQLNGIGTDPQTGMPTMVNALGSLDVDIILDESEDYVNMMAESFDTLSALAAKGAQVPPGLLIETAPIESSIKKKYLEQIEAAQQNAPPDPATAKLLEVEQNGKLKAAELEQTGALKRAELEQTGELKRQEMLMDFRLQSERNKMQADQDGEAKVNAADVEAAPIKAIVKALTAPKVARKMPDGSWVAETVRETA
jgi:hypothetical protein